MNYVMNFYSLIDFLKGLFAYFEYLTLYVHLHEGNISYNRPIPKKLTLNDWEMSRQFDLTE